MNVNFKQLLLAAQAVGSNWFVQLSFGEDISDLASGVPLDVKGIPSVRVYNESGSPATATVLNTATGNSVTLAGVSVATGTSDLVDVRGAESVTFNQAVSIQRVV